MDVTFHLPWENQVAFGIIYQLESGKLNFTSLNFQIPVEKPILVAYAYSNLFKIPSHA